MSDLREVFDKFDFSSTTELIQSNCGDTSMIKSHIEAIFFCDEIILIDDLDFELNSDLALRESFYNMIYLALSFTDLKRARELLSNAYFTDSTGYNLSDLILFVGEQYSHILINNLEQKLDELLIKLSSMYVENHSQFFNNILVNIILSFLDYVRERTKELSNSGIIPKIAEWVLKNNDTALVKDNFGVFINLMDNKSPRLIWF